MKCVFNFQQRLLFAHSNNHRYNSETQISAVTWRTVHEPIVADAFRYLSVYVINCRKKQ